MLWLKADGTLVVDSSGRLMDCETCPCDEGGGGGDPVETDCGTFAFTLEVAMAFYSSTGEGRVDIFYFDIDYEDVAGVPNWYGCYTCGSDEVCLRIYLDEGSCEWYWKLFINGDENLGYWSPFNFASTNSPLYQYINAYIKEPYPGEEVELCGFLDIVRVGFNVTEP